MLKARVISAWGAAFAAMASLVISGISLWQSHEALELTKRQAIRDTFVPLAMSLSADCELTVGPLADGMLLQELDFIAADPPGIDLRYSAASKPPANIRDVSVVASFKSFALGLFPSDRLRLPECVSEEERQVRCQASAAVDHVPILARYSLEQRGELRRYNSLMLFSVEAVHYAGENGWEMRDAHCGSLWILERLSGDHEGDLAILERSRQFGRIVRSSTSPGGSGWVGSYRGGVSYSAEEIPPERRN